MIPLKSNFYHELNVQLSLLGFVRETCMQDSFPIWLSKEKSILIQAVTLLEFKNLNLEERVEFQHEIISLREKYNVAFRVWEDVWFQRRDWILNFFKFQILQPKSIFARDTQVVILTKKDVIDFAESNHLFGLLPGNTYLGCIVPPHRHFRGIRSTYYCHGNPLMAIAVFGKDRIFKSGPFIGQKSSELIQICTDSSIRLVGGLTKFISFYQSLSNFNNLMTYTDLEWSDGGAFSKIGFEMESITEPLYFNVLKNGRRALAMDRNVAAACNSGNMKFRLSQDGNK